MRGLEKVSENNMLSLSSIFFKSPLKPSSPPTDKIRLPKYKGQQNSDKEWTMLLQLNDSENKQNQFLLGSSVG